MVVRLKEPAYNCLSGEAPARYCSSGPGAARKEHLHNGADLPGVLGEPVLAFMAGVVRGVWVQLEDGSKPEVSPGEDSMVVRAASYRLKAPFGFGLWVEIEHNALGAALPVVGDVPIVTRYHHLSHAFVRKGQSISPGELLGALGHSGVGSGFDHVHFGVSAGDYCLDPRGFQLWTKASDFQVASGKKVSTSKPSLAYGTNVRKLWPITHVVATLCFPASRSARGEDGVDGLAPTRLADGTIVVASPLGKPVYMPIVKSAELARLGKKFGDVAPLVDCARRGEEFQRSGFGDVVCVEGDCKLGESLVAQMKTFYTTLVSQPGDLADRIKTKFAAPVAAILKAKDDQETWARRWMPFAPQCCAIRDIGKQAQALTSEMAKEAGTAAPSSVPVPWVNEGGALERIGGAAESFGKVALTLLLIWGGVKILGAVKETRSAPRAPRRKELAA